MRILPVLGAFFLVLLPVRAADSPFEEHLDLKVDGRLWLSTVTTPLDPSHREGTYKVYTHIYDFEGNAPITKGPGGKYTHHRGMFIGWRDTVVNGRDIDTWSMPNSYQKHVAWLELDTAGDVPSQAEELQWCDEGGKAFIKETRRISVAAGKDGARVIDFASTLTSLAGTIPLKGDLQHAGMHVRMANEVSEHEDSTQYVLPDGAEEQDDDKVVGAWWVACSPVVRGKRYWLVHMTPPSNPTGQPVYSIRRYGRFGAFFEPELREGEPLPMHFRILVSEKELDRATCQALYDAFVQAKP